MKRKIAVLAGALTMAVALSAMPASANSIDFSCGGGNACVGSVSASGGNFSSSGITALTTGFEGDSFQLVFDTSTKTISLTELGDGGDALSLTGTIASFSSSSFGGTTNITLNVNWNSLPADAAAALGSQAGAGSGSVITLSFSEGSASVASVDIPITSVPEPATLALLGAGLLGLGGMVRRKRAK